MKKLALVVCIAVSIPTAAWADDNDDEDDGGSDFFWVEGSVGYSYANIVSFSNENFLPTAVSTEGSGVVGSLGLGLDILFFRIGARASLAKYGEFNMGTATAELNFDIPLFILDLWIRAGFGFAWVGNIGITGASGPEPTINGWAAPLGAGINIPLGDLLYVGAGAELVLLRLGRSAIADAPDLSEDGDSFGFQLRVTAHLGLTF